MSTPPSLLLSFVNVPTLLTNYFLYFSLMASGTDSVWLVDAPFRSLVSSSARRRAAITVPLKLPQFSSLTIFNCVLVSSCTTDVPFYQSCTLCWKQTEELMLFLFKTSLNKKLLRLRNWSFLPYCNFTQLWFSKDNGEAILIFIKSCILPLVQYIFLNTYKESH